MNKTNAEYKEKLEYEVWTVVIKTTSRIRSYEFKGKSKNDVIKQIKMVEKDPNTIKVCWDFLRLDRQVFKTTYY